MRRAVHVLIAVAALWACTSPKLVEVACNNGVDDDANGLTDCDDPQCQATGRCETTKDACTNGVDDDANGAADCEDRTCVTRGFCEPFEAPCDLLAQTGCPRGMSCYVKPPYGDKKEECRLPGQLEQNQPCDGEGACLPGYLCSKQCTRLCASNEDCPFASTCVILPGVNVAGICTIPCSPLDAQACAGGVECSAFGDFGASYDQGGAQWGCNGQPTTRGTASVGMPCDDPPQLSRPAGICGSNLACVPGADGQTRCRALCTKATPAAGGVVTFDCPGGLACAVLYPLDPRPFTPNQTEVLGACIEP
jgi:hypothetical protein